MAEQPAAKPQHWTDWLANLWKRLHDNAENRDPRMPELGGKRVDNVLGKPNPRFPNPHPNARVPVGGNARVGDNGGNVFDGVGVRNRQMRQQMLQPAMLPPQFQAFRPVDEKPPINAEILGLHRRSEANIINANPEGPNIDAHARKALEGRDAFLGEVGGKNQKQFNGDMVRAVNKWAQRVFEGGAKSQAEYETARQLNGVWRSYLATKERLADPNLDPKRRGELEIMLQQREREAQAYIEHAAHGYILKPGAGRISNGRFELQNNGQWAAPEAADKGIDDAQQGLYAGEQKFQPGAAPVAQAPLRVQDMEKEHIAGNQRRIADKIKNDPGNMPEDEPLPPKAPEKLEPPAPPPVAPALGGGFKPPAAAQPAPAAPKPAPAPAAPQAPAAAKPPAAPQAPAAPGQRQIPPKKDSRKKLLFGRDGKPLRYQQPAAQLPQIDPAVAAAHKQWADANRRRQEATPHPLGFPGDSKGLPPLNSPVARPNAMRQPKPPASAYDAARDKFGALGGQQKPQPAPRISDPREEYDIARQEAALAADVAQADRARAAAKRKAPQPLVKPPSLPGQKPAAAAKPSEGASLKEVGNRAIAEQFVKPPQPRIPDQQPQAKPEPKDEDFERDLVAAIKSGKLQIREQDGSKFVVNPIEGTFVALDDLLPHAPSVKDLEAKPVAVNPAPANEGEKKAIDDTYARDIITGLTDGKLEIVAEGGKQFLLDKRTKSKIPMEQIWQRVPQLKPQIGQPIRNSRHGTAVKLSAEALPGANGVSAGGLATMQRYLQDVAQHHPEELQKLLQQHKVGEREHQYAWLDKLGKSTVDYLRHLAGQKPSIGAAAATKLPPKIQKLAQAVLTDPATYRRSLRELHHELIGASMYAPGSRPVWPDKERMLEVSGKLKAMGRLGELDQYLNSVAHGKPMLDHEELPAPTPPPQPVGAQPKQPEAPCHGCSGGMHEQVQRLAARGIYATA